MNKVFKIIWNHAAQNWVVVSELSSVKGKMKSRALTKIVKDTTGTIITLGLGLSTANAVLGTDLHFFSVKTGQTQASSNYDNKGATGEDSLAIGILTNATAQQSVAIGSEVTASGKQSLGIGNNVVASMLGATAIGNNSKATAEGAQSFGQSSNASGVNSAAIGRLATATASRASAFGVGNFALGESSFSGGDQSKASGINSIAIGLLAKSAETNTVSIGSYSGTEGIDLANKGIVKDIVDRTNQGKTGASGLLSLVSIGNEAGKNTINNQYGINIGHQAGSGGYNSYYGEGVAIGNRAGAIDKSVATIKAAMENASKAKGASTGIIVTGNTNTAISSRAGVNTLGHDNVAIGKDAGGYTSGNANIAIGRHAGRASKLNDKNIRIFDTDVFSNANNTMSLGEWSNALSNDSIALGSRTQASAINGVAIGKDALVTTKNSVVLGADSKDREATFEDSTTVNGISYSNFAGNEKVDGNARNANEISVLSVGAQYNERQIINVAPGKISATSTDAINGSQLYMTQDVIGNISKAVANIVGGNTTVNPATGAPEGFTQTLNVSGDVKDTADYNPVGPAKNISEAITQLNSYVNAGWKLGDTNGVVVDRVTPNDQVNFKDGSNTKVQVSSDGKTSNVSVNVVGLPVQYTKADGSPVAKVGDKYYPVKEDGSPDLAKALSAQDVADLVVNVINPTAKPNEIGKAIKLGNIASGTNTLDGTTSIDGKPLVKIGTDYYNPEDIDENGKVINGKTPVAQVQTNGSPAFSGLADLATSNPNNAVTVSDLRKMGWVLSGKSEDGKDYSTAVKNADEVHFIGKGLANVTIAKNASTGAQEITVDVKTGDVIKDNEGKATVNGQEVEVVKDKNGNYYKKSDIDPTTGEPKQGANQLTPDEVKTVVNNGDGLVTGHRVADAIQKSGWTVGKIEADKLYDTNVAFNNEDEKVNPNDNLRFADGKNTLASLGTVKKLDAEGNITTTTIVKVDVDLPVDFKYTDALGKEFVKANDGKFYAKDEVGLDGVPSKTAKALEQDKINSLKKGAQLTDGSNSNGEPNNAYEVNDPIQIAVQQAGEKAIKDILTANPNASPAEIAAAVEKATDKARIDAIKANPDAKDNVIAGSGGVNLNNVAWAEKPDQAVNKDQLDQTVNKSGFFIEQNGESTNGAGKQTEKVTPNDRINFVNGANTILTADTVRDEKTGTDKTNVTVNVSGLPVTYTTKQNGKDVPVVKVGDKYYQVNTAGKPDMNKPVDDLSTLSTNLVSPEAGKDDIGKPSQLGNVANGATTFDSPQVDGNEIKLANDGKWYVSTQVEPNGVPKVGSVAVAADKIKKALNVTNNGGLINFSTSNPNNVATVGDLQNLGFVISTGDDQYKEQVRHNNRIEFVSANKNATVTGTTRSDGVREVKVTISDTPAFRTVQVGGDNGPKIGATSGGDIVISKQENGNENAPARITNVAPGVDGNDAVTVNQLKEIKQNLGDVNSLINKNNRKLHAGIAGSNAAAGLPQVYIPGKSMVAAAAGTYGGQNAVAVGYSRSSDNGKVILKLQGNANTNGRFGGSVGVGYQW